MLTDKFKFKKQLNFLILAFGQNVRVFNMHQISQLHPPYWFPHLSGMKLHFKLFKIEPLL